MLLTDGASNVGPLPLDAAQQAADRGVRVYTIGFGTEFGGDMNCGSQSAERDLYGGGGNFYGGPFGGGGGGFRRGIDEETLKQVSAMTGGEYYSAESAGELQAVFENLPTSYITRHEVTEISVFFAAAAALLAVLAIALVDALAPAALTTSRQLHLLPDPRLLRACVCQSSLDKGHGRAPHVGVRTKR